MVTQSFVEHRLAAYGIYRGYMCMGCRNWGSVKALDHEECDNMKCHQYGKPLFILLPRYHEDQARYLATLNQCSRCKGTGKCSCVNRKV